MKSMKFLSVFTGSLSYAVLRYLVFGTVSVANLPCYVANKAISLSAVVALCASAYYLNRGRIDEQRDWFAFFKITTSVHVLLSVMLFSAEYYPKMFAGGKMNLHGELFILFGVLAVAMLMYRTIVRETTADLKILQPLSIAAIALHQLFLGMSGWLKWQEWPGYMPPITMIGFIVAVIAIVFQIKSATRLK